MPDRQPLDVRQVTETYFPRIRRAALVLRGNPWDADDLAQETFLVFSRQADRFQGRSALYTYLYGILLNLDRRERRRFGVRQRKLQVLRDQELADPREMPEAEAPLETREWKRSLWAWVDKLPEGQRSALVLRFSEGLQYDEVAEVLGCPLGTVKSRIFHGLAALRRLLSGEGDELRLAPAHPHEDTSHAI